jgi:hypothetical protein
MSKGTVDHPVEAAPIDAVKPALSDQMPAQLLETARSQESARSKEDRDY